MSYMFYGCSSLASLDLSSFDTSNVESMESLFGGCTSLESLDLSNFNTSRAKWMRNLFPEKSSLQRIKLGPSFSFCGSNETPQIALPTLDGDNLTGRWVDEERQVAYNPKDAPSNIAATYVPQKLGDRTTWNAYGSSLWRIDDEGCLAIGPSQSGGRGVIPDDGSHGWPWSEERSLVTSISIADGVEAPKDILGMFSGMAKLRSADLSGLDTSKTENMASLFCSDFLLDSIDISMLDTGSATSLESMFEGCGSLQSVTLSGIDLSSATTLWRMFRFCDSLEAIDLSGLNMSHVEDMREMFLQCTSLKFVNLNGANISNVKKLGSTAGSDGQGMFHNCASLEFVDLSSVNTSKVVGMGGMFWGCEQLKSLDLSSFNTSQVTDMHRMFSACGSLQSLVQSFDTSRVTDMAEMFSGCSALKSIDVSGFDTSKVEDMSGMFRGCSSLESIDVSKFDTTSVDANYDHTGGYHGVMGMFLGCSSLSKLDLSSFDMAKMSSASILPMLRGCSSLESISVSDTFSQSVAGSFPEFAEEGFTGKWISSVDGIAYSSDGIPSNIAATYTAQVIPPSQKTKIDKRMFSVDVGPAVYTGFPIVKTITSPTLTTADYDVRYVDNVNAGTAAIIITGKGNCIGDLVYTFDIAPASITVDMVSGAPSKMEATGSQLAPEPIVTFNGNTLIQGIDYSLSYGENVSPGKGSVTVSAVEGGNFTGSVTVEFDIEEKTEPAPEPQQFAVIYHLDGGVNATDNPATYMAGTAVPLADPTKEGFEFQGWYADAEFTVRVMEIPADASGDVELWAKWKEQKPAPIFTDVDYSSWYGDAVSYVASKGLITGYTDGVKAGQFGVGDVLTRAQLATILWRNACPDEYASYDPETAVDTTGISGSEDGQYYTAAANWAVKNGVITGFVRDDGTKDFAADDDVSFEQLITILSRLCATKEELDAAGSDLSAFADGYLASDWSRGAFAWAADKGLVQGYDEPAGKFLRPGDPVARERVAVVLMRAFEMGIMK